MTGVGTIRALRSARVRILASIVLLLAASTLGSVIAIRQILLLRLDDRIESELRQETREFRQLVGGRDPATGFLVAAANPRGRQAYAAGR